MTMNFSQKLPLLLFFVFLCSLTSYAQEEKKEGDKVFYDPTIAAPLTFDPNKMDEEDEVAPKKKKRKKKVFYGIKTKKGYTKRGKGKNQRLELFYVLKKPLEPDPYVRDVYWYDKKSKMIKKTSNIDPKHGKILHGPYTLKVGDQIMEEGIFYVGTKHGRWTRYDRNFILLDKAKYFKGWPKESRAAYFDKERTKLKEITPIEFGKKEGNYFLFHDNGQVAVTGEFQNNEMVGVWKEYYKYRRKQKREIQYRNDPFDKKFVPYIIREWNEEGKLIYDREAEVRRVN
jgi:antitoxin component YwqK of YwqJK toxin-antitoxin module